MNSARDGLARSVQVRLARHAKAIGVDPNLVLTRYAVESYRGVHDTRQDFRRIDARERR